MRKVLIIVVLTLVFNIYAEEINLKYSSIDTSEAPEVGELINFYKDALIFFENMDQSKFNRKETVLFFINTLDKKELSRFLYLDSYATSRYPDFYEEFIFCNSIFSEAVSSGLFTKEDIYSHSIYPRRFIEPYFDQTNTSNTRLPTLNEIRLTMWFKYVTDNPEYSLLEGTFNKLAVVRFLNTVEVSYEDPVYSPLVIAECLIIDSENTYDIDKTFKVAITMFGEKREFLKDELYLINYGFNIKTKLKNYPNYSSPGIDPQRRFISHCQRIYSLSKDDTIEVYRPTHFSYSFNPLENFDFKTSQELISFINELRNRLKAGGGK